MLRRLSLSLQSSQFTAAAEDEHASSRLTDCPIPLPTPCREWGGNAAFLPVGYGTEVRLFSNRAGARMFTVQTPDGAREALCLASTLL